MKIQKVTDLAFRKYGKVLEGYIFSALLKEMKRCGVNFDPGSCRYQKWLIAHEDAKIEGVFNGLKGENITLD